MATSSAKGSPTPIVVIAAMPPRPQPLSTIQTMTKAISANETTISFKDGAPHNSLRVDRQLLLQPSASRLWVAAVSISGACAG